MCEMDSQTTVTLTFCEVGENHVGNQMDGQQIRHGLSAAQVRRLAESIEDSLIELNTLLDDPEKLFPYSCMETFA